MPLLAAAATSSDAPGPRGQPVVLGNYRVIRYVSARNGSDEAGDGSRSKPWATISHALSHTNPSGRAAVLVAGGAYRGRTIELKPDIDVFGGYDPASWRRDMVRNPSTLDGEGARRVVIGADRARLDGFIITHGRVRGKGGAVLCDGTSPAISNNTFLDNTTDGPENWNPPQMHETANDGGAIAVLNGAAPAIEHNLFARNTTENGRGAAIACDHNASPRIIGNVMAQNQAGLHDPKRSSDGGALSIYDHSNPLVADNIIVANRALSENDGGGIFIALWSAPRIENNRIVGNKSADDAGGVFVGGQKHHYDTPIDPIPPPGQYLVRLIGNVIIGNENGSHASGAARITMQARVELRNNIIAQNNARLYFQTSAVEARNNTVIDELLVINDSKASRELPGPTVLVDNIFWGKPDIRMEIAAAHCDFRGGQAGTDNLDKDPMFLDDGWKGAATQLQRDAARVETSLTGARPSGAGSLAGRAIRVGDFWTVIRSASQTGIVVWGVVPDGPGPGVPVEIAPSYRLQPQSPCMRAGEKGGTIGALPL